MDIDVSMISDNFAKSQTAMFKADHFSITHNYNKLSFIHTAI